MKALFALARNILVILNPCMGPPLVVPPFGASPEAPLPVLFTPVGLPISIGSSRSLPETSKVIPSFLCVSYFSKAKTLVKSVEIENLWKNFGDWD